MITRHMHARRILSRSTAGKEDSKFLLNCVANNALKTNPDNFHLLLIHPDESISVNVDGYQITNSKREKLLGITIDNKLSFNEHGHVLKPVKNYMLSLGFPNIYGYR